MRSTIGIDIAAPPRLVFDLAHDPARWPEFAARYRRGEDVLRDADLAMYRGKAAGGDRLVLLSPRNSDPAALPPQAACPAPRAS